MIVSECFHMFSHSFKMYLGFWIILVDGGTISMTVTYVIPQTKYNQYNISHIKEIPVYNIYKSI